MSTALLVRADLLQAHYRTDHQLHKNHSDWRRKVLPGEEEEKKKKTLSSFCIVSLLAFCFIFCSFFFFNFRHLHLQFKPLKIYLHRINMRSIIAFLILFKKKKKKKKKKRIVTDDQSHLKHILPIDHRSKAVLNLLRNSRYCKQYKALVPD